MITFVIKRKVILFSKYDYLNSRIFTGATDTSEGVGPKKWEGGRAQTRNIFSRYYNGTSEGF